MDIPGVKAAIENGHTGVLAAFVLLLSIVITEEAIMNSTSDSLDLPIDLSVIEVTDERQLMQFLFANKLRNACDLQNDEILTYSKVDHRVHFELEFLRHSLVYVNITKQSALEVLHNFTMKDCSTLHISNLPHTPTLTELKKMDIKGALNKIHSSLLVHSGYSYLISHQLISTNIRCSEDIVGEQKLLELSQDLAEKQRFLACRLHLGMKLLGYNVENVSSFSVLNESVSGISECSSKSLRDCQVMKSINNFLQIFTEYVSNYISESLINLPNTHRTVP